MLPLLISGHILEIIAAARMRRDSRYGEPPDLWAFLYEGVTKRRFALKPHRAAGTYVLLPLHNFVGVFCLLSWSALVFLFASVKTNPFIYFQF